MTSTKSLENRLKRAWTASTSYLFPRRTEGYVRYRFDKPSTYVVACRESSGMPLGQYCDRRKELVQAFREELDRSIEWLTTQPGMRVKAVKAFEICGEVFE
jgi:hypothetical protein